MKQLRLTIIVALLAIAAAVDGHAQYYSITNQATNMLQTALQGGMRYRGMVDVSYMGGVGSRQANFLEVSTTQGVKYANWFFMGVGLGVDWLQGQTSGQDWLDNSGRKISSNACMIPLFSDFRFNIGNPSAVSFYIDLKVGASFLIGKSYVQVGNGYINGSECFYLKPSVGLRIPLTGPNSKLAMNVGAGYQLVSTNYWYGSSSNVYLNGLGASIGLEW